MITIEIDHSRKIDTQLYPTILKPLNRLITEPQIDKEEYWNDFQILMENGLTDGGHLLINPHVLLAALTFVSFRDSMNAVGQY